MSNRKPPQPPSSFGRDRPDPERSRNFVRLYSACPGKPVSFTALNDRILFFETHWVFDIVEGKSRSIVCTQAVQPCIGCYHSLSTRWKGYLGASMTEAGLVRIVEVTEGAWDGCRPLRQADGHLRGLSWTIARKGPKKNDLAVISLSVRPRVIEPKYPPVDVVGTLGKLWGIDLPALLKLAEEAEPVDLNGGGE